MNPIATSWITLACVVGGMLPGLFTGPNTTVIAVLPVRALSAASALYPMLEPDQPYGGFIRISGDPLRHALARIGQ